MVIKKVNQSIFDVFWGIGWDFWARFERQKDGTLKQVSGRSMPTKLFQQFRSMVNKKGKRKQRLFAARQFRQPAPATTEA